MDRINYKEMGKRICIQRKKLGLTQEKLAEKVEVSTSHIGEIERGNTICSLAVIVNIATVLGLNLDTLVRGIEEENTDTALLEILGEVPKKNKTLFVHLCESVADNLK